MCFLGSEKKANQIILENQMSMGKSENAVNGEKYFNNFKIFAKVLKQLYYLNSEGKSIVIVADQMYRYNYSPIDWS